MPNSGSIMSEVDVLADVAHRLDKLTIDYMITGSFAMNVYAVPRMTRDADLVVELNTADVPNLIDDFEENYYVSIDAAVEAVRHKSMFNAIHRQTVFKIDFIVRKDTDYHAAEFARRSRRKVDGYLLYVVSKEDLIITKIEWARTYESEQQLRDVKNLLRTEFVANT